MNPSRQEGEELIPINPYWVGGSFLDYCVRQGWMVKQREGRSVRYCCTPGGIGALQRFGIEILRPEARKLAQRAAPSGPRRPARPH